MQITLNATLYELFYNSIFQGVPNNKIKKTHTSQRTRILLMHNVTLTLVHCLYILNHREMKSQTESSEGVGAVLAQPQGGNMSSDRKER